MRISDWSSDVCSSDLGDHRRQLLGLLRAWLGWLVVLGSGRERLADAVAGGDRAAPFGDRAGDARRVARVDGDARGGRLLDVEDRKSVVSGKGVSVRLDLGGRRTIKKNKQ